MSSTAYQKLKVIEALSPREREEEYIHATEQLNTEWCNVHAIKDTIEGNNYLVRNHIWGSNIVTNAGDDYYAQRAAGETPTNDFAGSNGRLVLRTGTVLTPLKTNTYTHVLTPIATSHKTKTAGYPRTNDPDVLNTVTNKNRKVTWKIEYLTTEANATGILGGAYHIGGDSPVSGTLLLDHFNFSASFNKVSSETLAVYISHEMLGA
jgi:hypothetical protein